VMGEVREAQADVGHRDLLEQPHPPYGTFGAATGGPRRPINDHLLRDRPRRKIEKVLLVER